ncbi:hypothetical protein Y032_0143g2402 [Ancylostoma ceylanicum]|uniref:RING-type domain-containing protein n=1 Tax=Ancylostoma ceylanicum TaxID=53326 RepID=A0A016T336_9BILA|nr:hypothetical protein Y032_0143g2402 [Ancylostoma ceylanicum]
MDRPSSSTPATSGEVQPVPTHFLTELFTLDHLMMTSSSSKRSRLTCIAVSPHFLFLGTSTGGVSAYSRYTSARKRINSPSGPYHFINTKDGPVSTLCVNSQEGLVAVGNDSGRVHIVSLTTSSPSPTIQTLTRDTRKLDKVTSLVWSDDSKKLYSGHANGVVMAHHLGAKSPFRTACSVVATFSEGEIVQLDISGSQLLVSTQIATYVYDIEEKTTFQVGKKPRSGRMGACFFPMSATSSQVNHSAFIIAARPNGRVWEANAAGVVYRTHQLRENTAVPRPPVISSRTDYACDMTPVSANAGNSNEDVQLSVLQRLTTEGTSFILSASGSRLIVFDVDQSKIILVNDLEEEIRCFCVCGADVFVVFRNLPIPRKYTFCDRNTVVKKLLAKSLSVQSAKFILHWKGCIWPDEVLSQAVDSLSKNSGKVEAERLRTQLQELLESHKSEYDNGDPNKAVVAPSQPICVRLPSGIHRVVNKRSEDVDDCPVMESPPPQKRRIRSRSCTEKRASSYPMVQKRKSFPQAVLDHQVKSVLHSHSQIGSSESLRTLLQLKSREMLDAVKFVPTITIGNAAKSLAALAIATPINFSCLVPAEGRAISSDDSGVTKRRSGPSIVKAVRPCKVKPVASVRPLLSRQSQKPEVISSPVEEQQSNRENSNDIESTPEPGNTACTIVANDDENNVDLNFVMERLAHLQTQTVTNDNGPIPSATEDVTEASQSTPSSSSDCCDECRIHRSWLAAAMLAKVCRRIKICANQFSAGAVPSLRSDWRQLLEFRFTSHDGKNSPCARCETAICSCLSIFAQGSASLDFVSEKVRPNAKRILERCASIDDERMNRILFEGPASLDAQGSDDYDSSMATVTNDCSPEESARTATPEGDPQVENHQKTIPSLEWLLTLDVRVIFAIASLVLGYQELISLVKESTVILNSLLPEHWSALSLLCVREQAMKKDRVNSKVVADVLQKLNLSSLISVDSYKASPAKRDTLYKQTPMYSWIIDCNSSCLICTLSLKSDVNNKDLAVTSFICGHAYHTVCLVGRFGGCLACRMRMKNTNMRRTAQPSKP